MCLKFGKEKLGLVGFKVTRAFVLGNMQHDEE